MDSWVDMIIYVHSTCKGVLDKALKSWVSVSSFKGIRFRIRISRGRISWLEALASSMINTFSLSSMARAGRSF